MSWERCLRLNFAVQSAQEGHMVLIGYRDTRIKAPYIMIEMHNGLAALLAYKT